MLTRNYFRTSNLNPFVTFKAPSTTMFLGLTTKFVEKTSEDKLFTSHQEQTIKQLKKQVFGEPEPSEPKKKKKRKGPKGPNPLSCKKKQKKAVDKLNGVKDKLESQGKRRKKKKKKNLMMNDVM